MVTSWPGMCNGQTSCLQNISGELVRWTRLGSFARAVSLVRRRKVIIVAVCTGFVNYLHGISGIPALQAAKAFLAIFVHILILPEQIESVIHSVTAVLN